MVMKMRIFQKNKNDKIKKSKEIIKKEKQKIKEEKKKLKEEKRKKFNQSTPGKVINKVFLPKTLDNENVTLKHKIFSSLGYELLGFLICLLVLFFLSGGKNFIKLYYDLQKLINVYDTVTSNYYGDLDKNKMIDKAIDSMLSQTKDNYTTYTTQKETNSFLETVDGTYEGIGCMVSMDQEGNIIVVSVFEDGPAKKAGMKEKDIILKIDGQDYKGKTSEDMSNYVKNSKNKTVKLTIKREEEEKEITINRKKVEVPSVESKIIEQDGKKVGYIDITVFSGVTYEQFKNQLEKLEKKEIQALIIDVRNDSGGYLTAVTDISSLFLKKGKTIYQLQDDKKKEMVKDKTKESRSYPIAVLVNAASASASEILASAIKESYGGLVVGTQTYGKGTVQKTKKLSDGSMIKYTIQKWLTPNGNWINEKGVTPTNAVEYEVTSEQDKQLQTATELLCKKIK